MSKFTVTATDDEISIRGPRDREVAGFSFSVPYDTVRGDIYEYPGERLGPAELTALAHWLLDRAKERS